MRTTPDFRDGRTTPDLRGARGIVLGLVTGAACWVAAGYVTTVSGADLAPAAPMFRLERDMTADTAAAVSRLVDEISEATRAPTRSHEQRVELLLHIRRRIDAELHLAPEPSGG